MRILFLSNFYPPYDLGGYEQWCYEVANLLRQRGHAISVLTSGYGVGKERLEEEGVYRLLALESDVHYYQPLRFFGGRRSDERRNRAHLRRLIMDFAPDVVFVWGMWNLSHTLPAWAERQGGVKVVYYLSNLWPAETDIHVDYWQRPARRWYMQLPKRLAGRMALALLALEGKPVSLQFRYPICVSEAVRDHLVQVGVPLQHAQIIYGGTDVERFLQEGKPENERNGSLALVYAGQLGVHKGVHTLIEALGLLSRRKLTRNFTLTIVGAGHPDYERHLRDLVSVEGLEEHVTFYGRVQRSVIPKLLSQFDVLVFPSIWEEPFARMVLEGMAAGLVVVGTLTGGSKEILAEGQNSLTFAAGDADGLAAQIERLIDDPQLCQRLADNGRELVSKQFNLKRMVDQIEAYLADVWREESGA